MKYNFLFLTLLMLVSLHSSAQKNKNNKNTKEEIVLTNEMDSVSYSLGMNIGQNLKNEGLDSLNIDMLAKAMKAFFRGDSLLFKQPQAGLIVNACITEIKTNKGKTAKAAGEKFMAENKSKPGVVTLPSGLQYQVLVRGTGEKPGVTDKVTVHYHGTLIDGTVFDSSVDRGQPMTHPVNKFIPGWTEALIMMPVGSKWKLFVPYQLAYGEGGYPPKIPPYSALIFEMELLSFEKQAGN